MKEPFIPVILAGGAGKRLWPVSREAHPKPFMKLPDGQSLLEKTFLRAQALPGVTEILTVTNREYLFKVKNEHLFLTSDDIKQSYLLEPEGRDTAPAIAMAALYLYQQYGNDVVMLVMPADHLISNHAAFQEAITAAKDAVKKGSLITFGIRPHAPETGYGYIESESNIVNKASKVIRFVEKPDYETACQFIQNGRYFWNSGMFCFQIGVFLQELEACAPLIFNHAKTCLERSLLSSSQAKFASVLDLDKVSFGKVPAISIDYAVMEKTKNLEILPSDFDWNDIGSWTSISSLITADESGNRVSGEAFLYEVKNSYVQSEHRMVALMGVDDLIVVETNDAVLVTTPDYVQNVRHLVERLKSEGHYSYKDSKTVHRPWGTFNILDEGNGYKIKRIVVKPEQALSLQMHHHRSEHWIVVKGTARVVNGDEDYLVQTNESTYIKAGHKHRLENPGVVELVLIEVQSGEYLGEDDIVRFEDQYGRI